MQGKKQFRNSLLNIISLAASAALAIAVVFALTVVLSPSAQAQTWTEKVLHSFGNGLDGAVPTDGLIFDGAGNLYGTTYDGGTYCAPPGCGTVFELTPTAGGGWTEQVLHSFNPGNGTDGSGPYLAGLIFDAAGNLYGTTAYGGYLQRCQYGCGTAFELTPVAGGGWTEQVLYSFDGTDGFWPFASLIFDAEGNLYGTTQRGGTSGFYGGTVFELTPTAGGGWTEKVLHNFGNGTDGAYPSAGLIFDAAGNLYGTTFLGGTYGSGTVFELTPTAGGGWTETVLYSFNLTDGYGPYAGLIFDAAGNLYGTTSNGGTYSAGTAFELTPTGGGGWTETVLHSFNYNGTDGYYPWAGVILDAAGNLYGTTSEGGSGGPDCGRSGCGTVFELTPTGGGSWTEQVLHSFTHPGTDGYFPVASLIFDAAGNLYGTTEGGGTYGGGTAFELMPVYPCAKCTHAVLP